MAAADLFQPRAVYLDHTCSGRLCPTCTGTSPDEVIKPARKPTGGKATGSALRDDELTPSMVGVIVDWTRAEIARNNARHGVEAPI